jgi:putative aminopeptidase FrvX
VAIPALLRDLLAAPGPSGREAAAARVWREAASAFAEVTSDAVGSSVARVGGTGGAPLLALVGHIDEIGLVVTHVSDEGFASFRGLGGWNPQVLYGQRVEVLGRDGRVPALVGRKWVGRPKPGEERKAVEYVVTAEPLELSNRRLASRALDNRLGAYAVLEAARRLAEAHVAADVAAVAPVGEEAGDFSGARTVIHGLEPDVAIVVDVTDATDVPGGDPKVHGELRLGAGPSIGRGLPLNQAVSDLLFEVAEAEGIAAVPEIFAGTTSSDADAVHLSRGGIPTGLVSFPIRYLHTPNELVSLDDVEAAIRLLVAFAGRLRADTSFMP